MFKKIFLVALLAILCEANIVDDGIKAMDKKDFKKALKLFTKACDGGDAYGCNNLAVMYDEGTGVKQDKSKALGFYIKACNNGDAHQCFMLGLNYENGIDVKQDKAKSRVLYKSSKVV